MQIQFCNRQQNVHFSYFIFNLQFGIFDGVYFPEFLKMRIQYMYLLYSVFFSFHILTTSVDATVLFFKF